MYVSIHTCLYTCIHTWYGLIITSLSVKKDSSRVLQISIFEARIHAYLHIHTCIYTSCIHAMAWIYHFPVRVCSCPLCIVNRLWISPHCLWRGPFARTANYHLLGSHTCVFTYTYIHIYVYIYTRAWKCHLIVCEWDRLRALLDGIY